MRKFVLAVAVLALVVPASAQELVTNGNFNAGPTGWSTYTAGWGGGSGTITATGPTAPELNINVNTGSYAWYQYLTVIPGVTYTITGDWEGQNAGWAEVMLFNNTGATPAQQIDTAVAAGSIIYKRDGGATWTWSPFAATPPHAGASNNPNVLATGTSMIVAAKGGGSNSGTNLYFDNISVTPEPSMALLAFGGLPLLLRRRR